MKGKRSFLMFLSVLLFLAATVMWFVFDAIKFDSDTVDSGFSFVNLTFGKKDVIPIVNIETVMFKFSFLNLLPLIILIIGVLVSVLSLAGKKGLLGAKVDHVLLFLMGAATLALVFFVKDFAVLGSNLFSLESYKFDLGTYLVAGLSGGAALINLLGLLV